MKVAPLLPTEIKRLETLRGYDILDTLPEKQFDDLTAIAAHICGTPIALVSLVDESRQWFKSRHGLGATETPRDFAFCAHAILSDDVMIIPDSRQDERFCDNPLVIGAPTVNFYAGAPLITPSGDRLGTLCVIDQLPRNLDEHQVMILQALARQVVSLLELRLNLRILRQSNRELSLARDQADQATKAKANFLANMSHEIRTPMNGVIGMTQLLLDEEQDDQRREKLQTITECGTTLLTLVNDILDFSKIEAGKVDLESRPLDLHATILSVLDLYSSPAHAKKIKLACNWHEQTPRFISGDVTRIRQVLSNLVSNAIKFTQSGQVELVVRASNVSNKTSGEHLFHVIVDDTGEGIPADRREKLFQPFSQLDSSTTRKFGGTGLGLAICKGLCEQMNGRIWVEGKAGPGSQFHFTFAAASLASLSSEEPRTNESKATPAHIKDMRVLVAEDNPVNQRVIVAFLKRLGITPDLADDGLEAVKKAQASQYDLIFMDCHMPHLDGFQATAQILELASISPKPQIVALTASAMQVDKERCLQAGMRGFISKPFTFQSISDALNEAKRLQIQNAS